MPVRPPTDLVRRLTVLAILLGGAIAWVAIRAARAAPAEPVDASDVSWLGLGLALAIVLFEMGLVTLAVALAVRSKKSLFIEMTREGIEVPPVGLRFRSRFVAYEDLGGVRERGRGKQRRLILEGRSGSVTLAARYFDAERFVAEIGKREGEGDGEKKAGG